MKYKKPQPIDTDHSCAYGCGNQAKFINVSGKLMCEDSPNKCVINRSKNSKGVKKSYDSGERTHRGFTDEDRANAKISNITNRIDKLFDSNVYVPTKVLRNTLFNTLKIEKKCQCCGLSEWLGEIIPVEIDHIDGNNRNNNLDNLRVLCHNCHALTPTYRGRNINSGKKKVEDDTIVKLYEETGNIRQTLIKAGLAPKGGNYARVKKLIN